ncbi:antiviral reverse transcriptase Drt5 [Methylibium sp. Root1272]|uniref:antiviral reverse transcriptase Drt5 n=1 Tax=Methylibium sp. Root1272 TaxID=1736441 RepID=UPI000A6FFF0A|nr:antiviral reverse transcriptase Drt5 [Methylibium sp. Root1272]
MSTEKFFIGDFPSTLYPLQTNLLMVSKHGKEIAEYINNKILSDKPEHAGNCFLPQQRVYAPKPRNHLRRTVCLDPIASYFLYDIIYRNRASFRKPVSDARKCYGYRFDAGEPILVRHAYKDFCDDIESYYMLYANSLKFDIASYFNSIYHHDLVNWFASLKNSSSTDIVNFGRFFREINAGRSIDFLPHGIYPAKMIGSEFLKFIDLSKQIKSSQVCRFMDDFFLFDNNESIIRTDFLRIQELLGAKGLNINPSKTDVGAGSAGVNGEITEIQAEIIALIGGDEIPALPSTVDVDNAQNGLGLSDDQADKLLTLLTNDKAEEADVERILSLLKDHADSIVGVFGQLVSKFPGVVKHLSWFSGAIKNKEDLSTEVYKLASGAANLIEYQIFWLAVICEDHLKGTKDYSNAVLALYGRSCDYPIARAKILEMPDQWYGLKEIRDEYLKTGASHWLSWASAMGTRTLKLAERKYVLDYFSKGSPVNHLVASCVTSL